MLINITNNMRTGSHRLTTIETWPCLMTWNLLFHISVEAIQGCQVFEVGDKESERLQKHMHWMLAKDLK